MERRERTRESHLERCRAPRPEPSLKAVPTQGHTRGPGAAGSLQAGVKKKEQSRQEHPSVPSLSSLCLPAKKATMKPLPSRAMKTYDLRVRKIILLMPGNCILII